MYDKIIFLDIDGVLNTYKEQGIRKDYVDPVKVNRVKQIVDATGAQIVISSNWRFDMEPVFRELAELKNSIIGRTGLEGNRIKEIEQWLDNNPTKNWIVIDDLFLFFPGRLIHTKEDVGITDADVSKAISILSKENTEEEKTGSIIPLWNTMTIYSEIYEKVDILLKSVLLGKSHTGQ
jgi:hypothetical protein